MAAFTEVKTDSVLDKIKESYYSSSDDHTPGQKLVPPIFKQGWESKPKELSRRIISRAGLKATEEIYLEGDQRYFRGAVGARKAEVIEDENGTRTRVLVDIPLRYQDPVNPAFRWRHTEVNLPYPPSILPARVDSATDTFR